MVYSSSGMMPIGLETGFYLNLDSILDVIG